MDTLTERSCAFWKDSWDSPLHCEPEQIKRLYSAQKIADVNVTVHDSSVEGSVAGSSPIPYRVTLNSCECGDFRKRRKPCKHIYRLAIALNVLTDMPLYNKNAAKAYDFASEVEHFYLLYAQGLITGEQYAKISDILLK